MKKIKKILSTLLLCAVVILGSISGMVTLAFAGNSYLDMAAAAN